jgi:exodeoxyribonuclease-3
MVRLMTYNIKTGGSDRGDSRRLDAVLRVVASVGPDLLALQELRGFTHASLRARIGEPLGMRGVLACSWTGQPVALLVRPAWSVLAAGPVRRPFRHAAARVVVDTSVGPLTVVGGHLDPYRGRRRAVEAGWLLSALHGAALGLVCGDLNTLDPWSDHTARLDRLDPVCRRRHLRGPAIDTRAVQRLAAAGLVDLFRAAGSGTRTTTAPTGLGGAEFSAMRLDYLMATPRLAALVRHCRIVDGGRADEASDHYPVVADADVDPS